MGLTKPRAAQIYNLDYKQSVRVVTVANITLTGGAPAVVDGVNLSQSDRILVTGQTTGTQNGLYQVATVGTGSDGTWTRTNDGNDTGEIESGMIVMVTEGTVYKDTQWKLTTENPITIGTTTLVFDQNYSANSISAGSSNVSVLANANVTISSAGTANVLTVSSTGLVVAGNIVPSANVTYSLGTTSQRFSNLWLSNTTIYLGDVNLSATETMLTVNGANVLVGNTGAAFSTSGNITGGNVLTGGIISATGNVTGNYFLGNGSQLTGVSTTSSNINNGTSNVTVVSSDGNVTVGVGGTGNVLVFATTGEYVTGVVSASGNVTGGNILTGGLVSATGNITTAGRFLGNGAALSNVFAFSNILVSGQNTINATSITSSLTFAGGSNISITTDSANGIITVAQASTSSIFATGGDMGLVTEEVTSSEDLGLVTSIATIFYNLGTLVNSGLVDGATILANTTYANIFITNQILTNPLSTTGNVTGGNVLTGGLVSATGTVTGSSLLGAVVSASGTVTAASVVGGVITGSSTSVTGTTTAASVVGGVITGSSLSASGNVTGGNLITGGIVSATGNITSGNITITSALSVGGNITSHAILETANIVAAAPASTTNFDIITAAIQYYTSNANVNFTLNFRGNSTTTANTLLATGQSTTTALLVTNGASAYYPTVIQVDGSNVTPKWQGGTAPTSGDASALDIYSFTLIKTAANTYTVLGSQTKFA